MSAVHQTPFPWRLLLRWLVFGLFLAGLLTLYVTTARRQMDAAAARPPSPLEQRHLDLTLATQADFHPQFIHSVSGPLKKLVPHRTDGVAQPLWPWVAALLYDARTVPQAKVDEAAAQSATLRRTAWFRLGLTLSALFLLAITCARNFSLPAAMLVTFAASFHGLLPTAAAFTGAAFFHLFILLTWLACIYALQRNSLWVYGVIGGFGALAYMSEDRALPILLVFVFVSTVRALWGWIVAQCTAREGTSLWVPENHLFGLVLLSVCFFLIAGPRLAYAQTEFGNGLFSYVDQVRWLDDPAQAQDWITRHPDAQAILKTPDIEKLTAPRYQLTHPPEFVFQRFWTGLKKVGTLLAPRGGGVLAVLLVLLLGMAAVTCWALPKAHHAGQRLHPETAGTALWIVSVTAVYGAIAAWDAAVLVPDHLLALVFPLALSLVWGCESVLRRARRRGAGCGARLAWFYKGALCLILIIDALQWARLA